MDDFNPPDVTVVYVSEINKTKATKSQATKSYLQLGIYF